jgi:hypothetical protein
VIDSNYTPAPPARGNLTINTLPYLTLTTPSLPFGTLNTSYSEQLTADQECNVPTPPTQQLSIRIN